MKTQLLYVLVSNENDIYLEQCYVSMFSAKMQMPECHITLLTDTQTKGTFTDIRKEETKYADEIIAIPLDPNLPAQKRSRLLKTNARNYIDGDFLFIDCDTIITRDLSVIDDLDFDLAASEDSHTGFQKNPYRDRSIGEAKKIGVDISKESTYFSSGVMLVKDNDETRHFYRAWNRNYLKGYEKGVFMDQPSMEVTNIELHYPIKTLSPEWNCVPKHGIKFLKDAYIVHYVSTSPCKKNDTPLFLLNDIDVFLKIKETGIITSEVKEVISDPFKGLADLTQCFAGKEIYFFQTRTYTLFIKQFFDKGKRMRIERLFDFYTKIKAKLLKKL